MKSIKKKILSGLVIGSILLLPGVNGKAELKGIDGKTKNTQETYLYNRDFLNSKVINNLEINSDIVNILEGNNYNLVNFNNQLGFVDRNYITSNYSYNERKYREVYQLGVTTNNVNLRVGPDINEDKIKTIENGEVVEIILESDNGWYLVDYNNTLGFLKTEYAKVIDFDILEREIKCLPKVYRAIVAKVDVNIRSNPNIESEKIGLLKKNKKLLISKILDNGWIEVTNNKKIGYVNGRYVKEIYVINGNYYKQVYMKNNTYIYNYPYSSIIKELEKYETAFVYGETDDFYLIESEGYSGFIRKIDVEVLNNKYIVVDISSQTMTLYDNLEKLLKSDVVTGKINTPTDLGIYRIYNKELNRTLTGDDYQTFVKYWIAYNKGEGLHDASWRRNFGGNIYIKHGSHGCVNLPTSVARKLYDEVSIGNKVLIKK